MYGTAGDYTIGNYFPAYPTVPWNPYPYYYYWYYPYWYDPYGYYPNGYYYYPQLYNYCPYCGKKLGQHICGEEEEMK